MALLRWLCLASAAVTTVQAAFDPLGKVYGDEWNGTSIGTDKSNTSYSNPISTANIGDPWITRYSGGYILTYTTGDNVTLWRSSSLTDNWDNAESRAVFQPDPKTDAGKPWSTDIWAPELHSISGKWYIIFTADPNKDAPPSLVDALCPYDCPAVNHRMFVLEADGSDPFESNYTLKGQIETAGFAIDGTYFAYEDNLYMIYSCWDTPYAGWPANLCIVALSDPWTVNGNMTDRRIISVPNQAWERVPWGSSSDRLATNEGPEQLTNPKTGQNFVLYSAARYNTPFYCLGQLELIGNDPMQPHSWRKSPGCVFHQNPRAGVYGPGHASFTTSPDGDEWYVIYHAITTPNPARDPYRTMRAQKFTWNEDGSPKFPPADVGPFSVPSGGGGGKTGAMML